MIHQYKLGGYNIVLDVCSGAIHVVDEVAYDIIEMFENNSSAEVIAAMCEKYAGREDISKEDIVQKIINSAKLYRDLVNVNFEDEEIKK